MHLDLIGIYQKSYFNDRFMHVGAPEIPCAGTVGVWSVPSSNDEMARIGYDFVNVGGLHPGFVMEGADHIIMRVCSAARCVRGYDFRGHAKTLALVNCCDEGNTYLPRFSGCGQISMTDFNIECFNAKFIPRVARTPSSPQGTGATSRSGT